MSTIWDRPTVAEAPTTTNIAETTVQKAPSVQVLGGPERMSNQFDGGNWDGGQWNVRGGVPRGRTEHDRVEALVDQYPFAASGAARLDAATRKALGR